jgi:two-component system, sensor histidine kinase FlrB
LHQTWIEVIARAFAPRSDDGHEISLCNGKRVKIGIQSLSPELGQIISIQDLTATRDWQEEQRLQAMGRMTAHLAHQIRTPLSSAIIYNQHALNPSVSEEKRESFLHNVMNCLGNIEQQIRDMLCFASGGTRVFEQITLGELLQTVERNAQAALSVSKGILQIDNFASQAILICHTESLQGALLNLINNAIQACDRDPEILLTAINDNNHLRISISDNGRGMSPEVQEKILQPFYTTRAQGTGLGLAVVHAVAKLHGGSVSIASAEGVGSCITINLPIIQGENS